MSGSLHLLRGDDEVLLGDATTELVHRLVGPADRNLVVTEFDGDEYPVTAVVDAAQTPPFLTDRRVVVARNLQRFSADDLTPLVAYLGDPMDTTDLVLVASGERLPKALVDAAKKAGVAVVATGAGRNRQERTSWIDERIAVSDVKLDPSAKAAIADWLGEDVGRLPALLETLEAVDAGTKLTAADVEPFLGEAGAVPPWDLTDAIDKGDVLTALAMLHRMLGAGGRHPLVVMATLQGHYERMLRLDGAAGVHDRSSAASVLKVAPFQAQKALEQGRRLGPDGLTRAFALLAGADLDLRGQRQWPDELVMEVLVARLARLAPKARAARR